MEDSKTCNDLFLAYISPDNKYKLIIEEDGRACYGYLLKERDIISDVWLYNCINTPETVDWKDKSQIPFLNPKKYCRSEEQKIIKNSDLLLCKWSENGVEVFYDNFLFCKILESDKPGYSYNAGLSGPLAKKFMDIEI